MPTKRIEIKKARHVFDLDSKGKKQIIKSGPNKGQPKMKLKTPAKYEVELDLEEIMKHFTGVNNQLTIVIEKPNHTHGAKSAATTHRNYGKILACAELSGSNIVTVAASKWKKDLGLPSDKEPCVKMAEELSGSSFATARGKLLDGPAEAF